MTENEALKRMKMCIGISPSENIISSFKLMSDALDELQQYRAIGTIEEFKALKEKNEPKEIDRYYCPICRHYFEDGEAHNYCPECGQKLEWQ